jgi:hypothetical protein
MSYEYEQGFSDGERQAFEDRLCPEPQRPRPRICNETYVRGYIDGYTPRNPDWVRGIRVSSHKELTCRQ